MIVGCGFAAMNLVFGEMIDDLAAPAGSVLDMINETIYIMLALAGIMGVTAFIAMSSIPYAAARIANNVRMEYLRAVLRQDMEFFDTAKPGAVVAAISEDTMDFELGISTKFGEGIQALTGVISGIAVAFYFSWEVTLVCCGAVPIMTIGFVVMMGAGVDEDGVTGKKAFEGASNVAAETLSAMRTVMSFGGEVKAAERFEARLVEAENASIAQGNRLGWGTGVMWASFFTMQGLAFWWGGKLVVESTRAAMAAHPIPATFSGPFALDADGVPLTGGANDAANKYFYTYGIALDACKYRPVGAMGKGDMSLYTGDAFDVCACNIPWDAVVKSTDESDEMKGLGITGAMIVDPLCGCGATKSALAIDSECVSGGRTTAVFFCVMIAGFMLGMVGPAVQALQKSRQAAARLYRVIDRRPAIDTSKRGGRELPNMAGKITLRHVHFRYPTAERDIFSDINLEITAGETVALVGESGAGKSTVARLVSRFYDPQQGQVLIDGVDIKELDLVGVRDQIGVVSQEPLLFDASIEENIAHGKPGGTSHGEVVEAAKAANAHDFIMQFPDGYATRVGARGGKLSGGQKQRVAIARALVRKPSVLVLDEATSALDNESERTVQAAIDRLTSSREGVGAGLTTIVIAHRLTTVRNADRIVVLGSMEGTSTAMGSTIVELGSHDELMQKPKGLYRALVGSTENGDDRRAAKAA